MNAKERDVPQARDALEVLCRTYYYPLYAFVRWQGHDAHTAEDLTQGFFLQFVAKGYLASVAPEKGKFRSFLLASLKHYLSVSRVHAAAIKRGGREIFVSLDAENVEERYLLEPKSELAPEIIYDRGWATTLMERALNSLREEFQRDGNTAVFDRLRIFLSREPTVGEYGRLATEMSMTVGALGVAVHRLRQRYGHRVRAEVASTVAHLADVEEELRYLFVVLTAS